MTKMKHVIYVHVRLPTGEAIEGNISTSQLTPRDAEILVYLLSTKRPEVYETWARELDSKTAVAVDEILDDLKVTDKDMAEFGTRLKRMIRN
jgi:hypothetical protein